MFTALASLGMLAVVAASGLATSTVLAELFDDEEAADTPPVSQR